jgi:Protein of unknown function (DUF4238)
MADPRPKKQHFIPELHLKHFVDANGMVWTYDIHENAVRRSIPKETAAQTNFYSLRDKDGNYDDKIEEWLSTVESEASAGYQALLRGELPKGEERDWLALFLACMYLRTPAMVRAGAEAMGNAIQAFANFVAKQPSEQFEVSLRRFEAKRGALDPEVRANMQEFLKSNKYKVQVARHAGLPILGAAQRLFPLFASMGWAVLDAGKQYFITSDYPVIRSSPGKRHPIYGDGGFLNREITVTMPLSPRRALHMEWSDDAGKVIDIEREKVRTLNGLRAVFAERHLFADRRDDGIRRLGEKHKESKFKIQVSGLGSDTQPVEVVRRLTPSR